MFDRKEFDGLVASAGEHLILFYFSAAWCGPCQKMKPIFNGFADEFPKVFFVTIDTDMNAETAKACQVTVMPTFQFYKNRRLIHTIKGADPQQLRDAIITHGRDKWDSLTGGQMLSGGGPHRTCLAFRHTQPRNSKTRTKMLMEHMEMRFTCGENENASSTVSRTQRRVEAGEERGPLETVGARHLKGKAVL